MNYLQQLQQQKQIAQEVGLSKQTVRKWIKRLIN